jgi:hypothetical protein
MSAMRSSKVWNGGTDCLECIFTNIRDQWRETSEKGRVPAILREKRVPIYTWNRTTFGEWIERATTETEAEKPKGFLDWLFS